ncbi:MAG: LysM peptidoglycan-binding domain-containing protein [Planctomycetes bacterium]|nr:LysM peptidoglycan-binding domain-containing protein [Planctomycetota bacterium]
MLRALFALALPCLAAACSDGHAAAVPSDGTLVLELGGDAASLRGTLANLGVAVEAPHLLREQPAAPSEPSPRPVQTQGPTELGTDTPPVPPPAPTEQPPLDYFVVTLAPRETLTHLAKRHLGDGTRYPEIMRLNGWTERDVLRLRPGREVKIPKPKPR